METALANSKRGPMLAICLLVFSVLWYSFLYKCVKKTQKSG
jgi:hypothetical protein